MDCVVCCVEIYIENVFSQIVSKRRETTAIECASINTKVSKGKAIKHVWWYCEHTADRSQGPLFGRRQGKHDSINTSGIIDITRVTLRIPTAQQLVQLSIRHDREIELPRKGYKKWYFLVCCPPMHTLCIGSKDWARWSRKMVRTVLPERDAQHGGTTIMKTMANKELKVFVDASFCGDWDLVEATRDCDTARLRHG